MKRVVLVVAALLATPVVVVLVSDGPEERHDPLADLTPQVAAHYEYAEAHWDEFSQIPCWCGCEQFLGHRHLGDCFVTADGSGREPHAAGCGVCLGEAAIAREMLEAGKTPAEVKRVVDREFGTTAITEPPS